METSKSLFLDYHEDAVVPLGCTIITSEVQFIRDGMGDKPAIVRGKSLCKWAEALWLARGLSFDLLQSPSHELMQSCPSLTEDGARWIIDQIGEGINQIEHPLKPLAVLAKLFPDFNWHSEPSLQLSAEWLLWLADTKPDPQLTPLILFVADTFSQKVPLEAVRNAYSATTSEDARIKLLSWLGCCELDRRQDWPPFPLEIPASWLTKVRNDWTLKIIRSQGMLINELRKIKLSRVLATVAAKETYAYYLNNPSFIKHQAIEVLSHYLNQEEISVLRRTCPPDVPSAVPNCLNEIVSWYRNEYLPYREWERDFGTDLDHDKVRKLARKFGLWYLQEYSRALAGHSTKDALGFQRARRTLDDDYEGITLLLILDGLPYSHALSLSSKIQASAERLTLTEFGLALATIPTITEFCKQSMVFGLPPREAIAAAPDRLSKIKMISENQEPSSWLQAAKVGDVFIWCWSEPDKSFHQPIDEVVIGEKVGKVLDLAADRIAKATLAVPSNLRLRIIVTTDHGRLLSSARRTTPIPTNMDAHGRAAWGVAEKEYDGDGLCVEEDSALVYIHKERFHLVDTAVVHIDDGAFETVDGRSRTEQYPHGGVFPEEVLIPWFEFTRDLKQKDIQCSLSGQGREGTDGTAIMDVINPNDFVVQLVNLSWQLGKTEERMFSFDETISARSQAKFNLMVSKWPGPTAVKTSTARATFRIPNGDEVSSIVGIQIISDSLYTRETTLEGLE